MLEFAVPVWHRSITGVDRLRLERIQKSALHIILGGQYTSYTSALKYTKLESLFQRRKKLCKTFARKSVRNTKFTKWFSTNLKETGTRLTQPKFSRVYNRTDRFERSPISYLTNILNKHYK